MATAKKTAKTAEPAQKGAPSAQATEGRGRPKIREGIVVSDKMSKTIVVTVTRLEQHKVYKKYVHKSKKYYAHDEKEQCAVGDLVRIEETRPLSKLKRWKLKEVVRKAEQGLERADDPVATAV